MPENLYWIGEEVKWRSLTAFRDRCNQQLGRNAILSVGSDGYIAGVDLTDAELTTIQRVNVRVDRLDEWESSKLRNLTLDQINTEVTTRQNEINAATNLAQAKTAMLNLLADDAKAWRIILWLLKREMNELD